MYKRISFLLTLAFLFFGIPVASAHLTVKPSEVGIGKFVNFSAGVPVERDLSTIAVRLVIPDGLQFVTPNVKPGWNIEIKKSGEGESVKVTELLWTGGSIPAGQRDEFMFSAKAPGATATLAWKGYQTYADGSVVAWDVDPKAEMPKDDAGSADFSKSGPYSTTAVIDDLAVTQSEEQTPKPSNNILPIVLSVIAIVLAAGALYKTKS